MNWSQFVPYPNHKKLGTTASVFLNEDKTLIKKQYVSGGITANGNPNRKTLEDVNKKFKTESSILVEFDGLWFMPKLIEINFEKKYIIQEYYGPDLLTRGFRDIPDIENQVVDIFEYIYGRDFHKINGSLSNMTQRNGKVIMFDFKYARRRSEESRRMEEYSIDNWLKKISPSIVPRLKNLL